MFFRSVFLIFRNQLKNKVGRFLLASAGIVIGVWAISFTTALSFSSLDLMIQAINSQTFAKQIFITRTENDIQSAFQTQQAIIDPISIADSQKILQSDPRLKSLYPRLEAGFYAKNGFQRSFDCIDFSSASGTNGDSLSFDEKCSYFTVSNHDFEEFYNQYKRHWVGSKVVPNRNEIVVCYYCGPTNLGESLGYNSPEELVGQEVTLQLGNSTMLRKVGQTYDVRGNLSTNTVPEKQIDYNFTVTAVIDDSDADLLAQSTAAYMDESVLLDTFKIAEGIEEIDPTEYGALFYYGYAYDSNRVSEIVRDYRGRDYFATSLVLEFVDGVRTGFIVVSILLSLFGLIAFIASVFGITNVMTITVLERQKEIGIIKSLGGSKKLIFMIFWVESIFIGIIGWLVGMILAVLSGFLIRVGFDYSLDAFGWRGSLANLNITEFSVEYAWWVWLISLIIAIFFTTVAGLGPALNAAKQNPVEVLRND